MDSHLFISNIPAISAVYYALLQTGYDYYSLERTDEHAQQIKSFYNPCTATSFFSCVKQDTCSVYPYWPRAAMLETATFYLSIEDARYINFKSYQEKIMSAGNISEIERNQAFWDWVKDFPTALKALITSDSFMKYMEWERLWIQEQNAAHAQDLVRLQNCLDFCRQSYASQIRAIQIVLSPIKCVYSSDYHIIDNAFIFTSGAFRIESVVHEFLHHVVHPEVIQHKEQILEHKQRHQGIDDSYYLSGNDEGQLNAFEEFVVRKLTKDFLGNTPPDNLAAYISKACINTTWDS